MLRHLIALGLLATALVAAPAWAAPQSVSISDPADGMPAISGSPRPDVSATSVTQDGNTVTVTLNFHGPALATGGSDVYATLFPVAVGKTEKLYPSDPNSSSLCSTFATMDVGFTTGAPYGSYKVAGATGELPFTSGPQFNADRTQLTWTMTHSSLAAPLDCVSVGPLYAWLYSTISHPDSRYNSSCDCWTIFKEIDGLGDDNDWDADLWFPGKLPPPSLNSAFTAGRKYVEGTPVEFRVYAFGQPGSTRTAIVSWFQGATLVKQDTGAVTPGKDGTFSFIPSAPGSYSVSLSHDAGTVLKRDFTVTADPNKPTTPTPTPSSPTTPEPPRLLSVSAKTTGKAPHARQVVKYRVCAPSGALRTAIKATFHRRDAAAVKMSKTVRRAHSGGCATISTSWPVAKTWRGSGRRVFKVRVTDSQNQSSAWRTASFVSNR